MIKPFMTCCCRPLLHTGTLLLLGACAFPSPSGNVLPPASQVLSRSIATQPAQQAAVTAHPLATRAALKILDQGGSPIDAAIAA